MYKTRSKLNDASLPDARFGAADLICVSISTLQKRSDHHPNTTPMIVVPRLSTLVDRSLTFQSRRATYLIILVVCINKSPRLCRTFRVPRSTVWFQAPVEASQHVHQLHVQSFPSCILVHEIRMVFFTHRPPPLAKGLGLAAIPCNFEYITTSNTAMFPCHFNHTAGTITVTTRLSGRYTVPENLRELLFF
jgi:hypothetical protein